jgi:pimeloyl-ACP methyl ester carboxylesterase
MPASVPYVDGVEHQEVVVRGLRIHLAVAGPPDGRPVILQHGWPQHWYEWRHLFGPLAATGHRVVAPDFRGFGWSEHPPDEDFRKETLVDDLVALCAELGHSRVAFVGHDWGCWVGWLLCLRRPDLVERAMLLSVRPPFPAERIDPAAVALLARLWYQVVIASPIPRGAKLAFFRRLLEELGRGADPRVLDAYLDPLRQPAQVRASTLLYRQFLTRELPGLAGGRYADGRLTMPIRFLVGRDDPLFSEEIVDEAAPHADDYAGEALPGVGHFVPEDAPDLLRERLLDFLGVQVAEGPTSA